MLANYYRLISTTKIKYLFLIFTLLVIAVCKLIITRVLGDKGFEPDSYLHFLQTKTVYTNYPDNLNLGIDVWAKPLYTYIHGGWLQLFSSPELVHAKLLNILIFVAISIIVFLIAQRLKLSFETSFAAAVISNIGFLSLRSSITVLTEPIFTLLFATSIYFWVRKNYTLSALLLGISVLGRIEALLFVAIWGAYKLAHIYLRKKVQLQDGLFFALLGLPVIVWNHFGYQETGRLFYLFDNGYPTEAGIYGYGHPFFYLEGLFLQEGMVMVLVLLGLFLILNRSNIRSIWDRKALQNNWLFLIVIFIAFTLSQTVLYMFGLFGTAGLMRYFIPIMPVAVLLGAYALEKIPLKFEFSKLKTITFLSVFILIYGITALSILRSGGFYKGLDNKPNVNPLFITMWDNPTLQQIAKDDTQLLMTNRPEVIYYSGRDLNSAQFTDNFDNIPHQTLLVVEKSWLLDKYDLTYFELNSDLYRIRDVTYEYEDIYIYYKP